QLRAQINSDRLAHAYLFVGESGLGKSATARALASALLPEAPLKRNPDYWEDDRIKPLSINEIRLLPDKPPEFHELSLQAFLNLKPALGAPADVTLHLAAQLDSEQMGWRRSEGDEEDPALFVIASWQIELRRRMLASRGREQGRWARLLELSYDTLGYLEQNVSPRLAF